MRKDVSLVTWADPANPVMDLLFIHGLNGDVVDTWRSRDGLGAAERDPWPLWLAPGLPDVAIHSLGYAAPVGRDRLRPKENLTHTAAQGLDLLTSRGIGARPLVVVAHSLGGLLLKRMLSRSQTDLQRPEFGGVSSNLRGVFFLATPHDGAELANLAAFAFQNHSAYITVLRSENEFLEQLKDNYIHLATTRNVVTWSLMEARALPVRRWFMPEVLVLVVGEGSAYAGVGKKLLIDRDHIEIARASTTNDRLFTLILHEVTTMVAIIKLQAACSATQPTAEQLVKEHLLDGDELDRLIEDLKEPGDVYAVRDPSS